MQGDLKEVYFGEYCPFCEYYTNDKDSDGNLIARCSECLENPGTIDSHKPVNFIKAKK